MSNFDGTKLDDKQIGTLIRAAVLAKGDENELRKIITLAAQAGWHAASGGEARDDVPDGVFFRGGGMDRAMRRRPVPAMAFDARQCAGLPARRARHV